MKIKNSGKKSAKKTDIIRALAIGMIITTICTFVRFNTICDEVRNSVFRLHILANSDTKQDQELKLKVRDAVLLASQNIFENCQTEQQAVLSASENVDYLSKVAAKTIEQNGYNYSVSVTVGKADFGNRDYADFSLPAGRYDALRIVIGSGEGHNWWCVMFPAVCLPAAIKKEPTENQNSETETTKTETTANEMFEKANQNTAIKNKTTDGEATNKEKAKTETIQNETPQQIVDEKPQNTAEQNEKVGVETSENELNSNQTKQAGFETVLSKNGTEIVKNSQKYKVKFKVVEYFETAKNFFSSLF